LACEVFQKGGNAQSVSLGRGYVGFLQKNPLLQSTKADLSKQLLVAILDFPG
jgi:hypothetical protein